MAQYRGKDSQKGSAHDARNDDNKSNRRRKKGKPVNDEREQFKQSPSSSGSYGYNADNKKSSLNDISWYTRNPNLTIASASIPFPYRPGMTLTTGEIRKYNATTGAKSTVVDGVHAIPGVITIDWQPSVGPSNSALSPISIVSKEIYAQVRKAFSGSLAVDPPDFVIYLMSLDSIFSLIGSLKRIYRILTMYTPENYIVPDALLRALGLTTTAAVEAWKENRMALFGYINELVGMTRKFTCPAIMDYFSRHYWLNDNVYTDAPYANSQFFAFRQVGYYKFQMLPQQGVSSVTVGTAAWNKIAASDYATPYAAYSLVKSCIQALAESEDAYTISGYLARAYDGVPSFVVDELSIDEIFEPVYVEEVLSQIENAHSIPFGDKLIASWPQESGTAVRATGFDVSQDPSTNAIICRNTASVAVAPSNIPNGLGVINPFVTSRSMAPTPADVVIATRLQSHPYYPQFDKQDDGSWYMFYQCRCASELVVQFAYTGPMFNHGYNTVENVTLQHIESVFTSPVEAISTERLVTIWTQFDWAPLLWYASSSSDATLGGISPLGDIHNFTTFSDQQLSEINRVCLFSEFNAFGNA